MGLCAPLCLEPGLWWAILEASDSNQEVQFEGGRDVQSLQAESRGSVGEQDREGVLSVHQ